MRYRDIEIQVDQKIDSSLFVNLTRKIHTNSFLFMVRPIYIYIYIYMADFIFCLDDDKSSAFSINSN